MACGSEIPARGLIRPIPLQPAVQAGLARAPAALEELGARVGTVGVPLLARATEINNAIVPPETMAQHARWQATWFHGREVRYGDDVAELLAVGAAVPGMATILAQHDRIQLARQIEDVFAYSAEASAELRPRRRPQVSGITGRSILMQ